MDKLYTYLILSFYKIEEVGDTDESKNIIICINTLDFIYSLQKIKFYIQEEKEYGHNLISEKLIQALENYVVSETIKKRSEELINTRHYTTIIKYMGVLVLLLLLCVWVIYFYKNYK